MWSLFLGIRYFFSKRKEGMISFIGGISSIGVAVGTASLVIVLSVMNGFDIEVREKIIDTYSHIVVFREGGISDPDGLIARLGAVRGVESASAFINGQAVLRKNGMVTGILLRGIDPEKEKGLMAMIDTLPGEEEALGEGSIVLGSELLFDTGVSPGDTVEVLIPYSATDMEKVKLRVSGSFTSGRYDYDSNMAVTGLKAATALYRSAGRVEGIAVRLADGTDASVMKYELQNILGYPFVVKSWMDLDRNLVTALAIEKKMMFIILALIVMVACFNISSSLIMMVMEKTRDIGILKALGANVRGISAVFMIQGAFIGAAGVVLGTAAGIYIANRINEIAALIEKTFDIKVFPSDIYYFSEIPVEVSRHDVSTVIIVALTLTVLAGIYPAWKAARLDPVKAIRYE